MGKEKQPYFCFQCGNPMENLPALPRETLSKLVDRFGCRNCNFVQEKDHSVRRWSPNDFYLNYKEYQEVLKIG